MSIVFDKEWHELPGPIAAAKLVEFRNELREKNLHDTEEPPLESSDRAGAWRRAHMPAPAMAPTTTWPVRAWAARECGSGATSR